MEPFPTPVSASMSDAVDQANKTHQQIDLYGNLITPPTGPYQHGLSCLFASVADSLLCIVAHLNERLFSLNNLQPRHTFVLVFIITLFLPSATPVELTFCTILVRRISIESYLPLLPLLSVIHIDFRNPNELCSPVRANARLSPNFPQLVSFPL